MNRLLLLALVCLLLLAAPSAHAETYTLDVHATDGGDRYWFEFRDYPGDNPTLSFAPGDTVEVNLTNTGSQPHNIHFGTPIARGADYIAPGRSTNMSFDVPGGIEPQTIEYWCDPHRQLGMVGKIQLGDNATAGGSAETPQDTPGVPLTYALVALVALAAFLCARRTQRQ